MKMIQAANETVANVWGKGKAKPGCYRLMTYTISVPLEAGTLLHNAVTGELVLLDNTEAEQISALPGEYAAWMDELIQKRFLVKAENDDETTVNILRTAFALATRTDNITHYTILPTTCCNARCFYCYEAGCRHETMNDETADKLVGFMASHRGDEALRIGWFGGEPLVGIRQIDRISEALRERKIPFKASMISNGYLFTEEIVKRAKGYWNLKHIQITLDGTEQTYNRTKNYCDPCESPYRQVLRNIGFLLAYGIRVSIRLNLGLHNAADLTRLVDELGDRFRGQEGLSVYVHLLYEGCGFEPTHFDNAALSVLTTKREALTEQLHALSLDDRGISLPRLKVNSCMADGDNSLVVLPGGQFGKCEHYTDSHFVGSIEEGVTDHAECKRFKECIRYPYCSACPLYPSCIILKQCRPDGTCTEALAQIELRRTERNILFIYEGFLRDDKESTEPAELPVC